MSRAAAQKVSAPISLSRPNIALTGSRLAQSSDGASDAKLELGTIMASVCPKNITSAGEGMTEMQPKPSLDEMIGVLDYFATEMCAAVRLADDYGNDDLKPIYKKRLTALRAALDTLREHERVMAERDQAVAEMLRARAERDKYRLASLARTEERDAARAELAEARAEIRKLQPNPCNKIFEHMWLNPECVENGCRSSPHAAPPPDDAMEAAELWRDLCEKDDRTSPEDHPDMAMIREDEFMSVCAAIAALAREDERARILAPERAKFLAEILVAEEGRSHNDAPLFDDYSPEQRETYLDRAAWILRALDEADDQR